MRRQLKWSTDVKAGLPILQLMYGDILPHPVRLFGDCSLWQASWIASHLWTQYEFTQDKQYLAETAYPLLKGNAQFILDFLAKDPKSGYLMTGPSISPENWFRTAGGEEMVASMMPACDRELAYEILSNCVRASEILDTDREFADSLRTAIANFLLSSYVPMVLSVNGLKILKKRIPIIVILPIC